MKKIIIGLIALTALAGAIFLLSGKSEKASKKLGAKIEDKIYVAVEEAGEIAVISVKDRMVIKRIDLSAEIGGVKIGFMPHNVQVAPDNKSVWVTANAVDMSQKKVSFKIVAKAQADEGHGEEAGMMPNDEIIVIDPLTDQIIKRIEMGTDLHLSPCRFDCGFQLRHRSRPNQRRYLQNQRQNLRSGERNKYRKRRGTARPANFSGRQNGLHRNAQRQKYWSS